MATYNKYLPGTGPLTKAMNVATDAFKIALATTVTNTDTTFTPGTTDLATANGYTAGGNAAATVSSTVTAGVMKLILSSPTAWTATGAGLSFRYVILWDSTTSNPIGYWDYGSTVTLAATETFTVTLDGTNGTFTVT